MNSIHQFPSKISKESKKTVLLCQPPAVAKEDKIRQLEFAKVLLARPQLLSDILWSDESYFSLEGTVNRHNCRLYNKGV